MPDMTNDTVIATVMERLMADGPQAMAQIICQRRSKSRPMGGAKLGHSAMSASARALSR